MTCHPPIPSRMSCKSDTEILNSSVSAAIGTALRRNPVAALRKRLSATAATVGFPVLGETRCSVNVSDECPCVPVVRLSRRMTKFTSIEPTVTMNSVSDTVRLSQSICTAAGVNCLDGRFPLVMTSTGNIRIIGQRGCEREDRLRREELALGGRKRLLQTFINSVERFKQNTCVVTEMTGRRHDEATNLGGHIPKDVECLLLDSTLLLSLCT